MKRRVTGPLLAASLYCICGAAHAQHDWTPAETAAASADSATALADIANVSTALDSVSQAPSTPRAPSDPAQPVLSDSTARALVDTLLGDVVALRGLKPKRPVNLQVAGRAQIRKRLEEIIVEEQVEPQAREEEKVLRYLGLIPEDADLLEVYKDLVEEQLAGMYDIDRRVLVMADWLPSEFQTTVMTHELVHALQDQHFSLRVRKKLGFETPDAEAAWQALVEGDATALMLQSALRTIGEPFEAVIDSLGALDLGSVLGGASGLETQKLLAAPSVVRDALHFPYQYGLGLVGALYRDGGWKRVDEAYLRPPISTEQVLHPERFIHERDMPIRIEMADVRGILGPGYVPDANLPLGEFDLYLYLSEYADPELAVLAAEGWGGAWLSLYAAPEGEPDALVMVTTWDTREDAGEFYGVIMGVLDKRYPDQTGNMELIKNPADYIVWNVDPEGRYQNVLRLVNRHVEIVEQVPAAVRQRVFQKIDLMTKFEDPTPTLRASAKSQLPWNDLKAAIVIPSDSALTLHPRLPHGWTLEPPEGGRGDVVLSARRDDAKLEVIIDRDARDRLGVSGYAHALAARIQRQGSNVYIQKDNSLPRDDLALYQLVFSQAQDGGKVVYYIAVADLIRGFGYVLMSQPEGGQSPSIEADFYEILKSLAPVPWTPPVKSEAKTSPGTDGGGDSAPRSQSHGG